MSMTPAEALAAHLLLHYLLHQPDPGSGSNVDDESAHAAAVLLADAARAALPSGLSGADVAALWESAPPVMVRGPAFVAEFTPATIRAWFADAACPDGDSGAAHTCCDGALVETLTDRELAAATYKALYRRTGLDDAQSAVMTDIVKLAMAAWSWRPQAARSRPARSSSGAGTSVMDLDGFWAVMAGSPTPAQLHMVVTGLDEVQGEAFLLHFHREHSRLYDWGVWAAATVIAGGCGDDGFIDFRSYLLSRGHAVCAQALADPDSLAEVDLFDVTAWVPWTRAVMGASIGGLARSAPSSEEPVRDAPAPAGSRWKSADLRFLVPRLWARYNT